MARNNSRRARHDFPDDGMLAFAGPGLLSGEGGGAVSVATCCTRVKPHLPPWLAVGATGVAGALGHWRWADSAAAGVGLTLSSRSS